MFGRRPAGQIIELLTGSSALPPTRTEDARRAIARISPQETA
jgi:hypothetical protein